MSLGSASVRESIVCLALFTFWFCRSRKRLSCWSSRQFRQFLKRFRTLFCWGGELVPIACCVVGFRFQNDSSRYLCLSNIVRSEFQDIACVWQLVSFSVQDLMKLCTEIRSDPSKSIFCCILCLRTSGWRREHKSRTEICELWSEKVLQPMTSRYPKLWHSE